MKKCIALCLLLAFALTGCSVSGATAYERRHYSERADLSEPATGERSYISTRAALHSAIRNIVNSGMGNDKYSDILMIRNYPDDVVTDAEDIAAELLSTDPICAYGVMSITPVENGSTLNITEIMISVVYHTDREVNNVLRAPNTRELERVLRGMFQGFSEELVVYISEQASPADKLDAVISKVWHQMGERAIFLEGVSYEAFPKEGADKVIVITPSYLSAAEELEKRQEELTQQAAEVTRQASEVAQLVPEGLSERDRLIWISDYLEEHVYLDITETSVAAALKGSNPKGSLSTAYGALVDDTASQEGITLAAAIILQQLGIPSTVMMGSFDNELYYWLILECEGETMHFDVTPIVSTEINVPLKPTIETTEEGEEETEPELPEYVYLYTMQEGNGVFDWDVEVYGEF